MSTVSQSTGEPRTASSPFDKPSVDTVILRTADRVDFHVWKCVLQDVSPVFADMFQAPSPPATDEQIPVTEPSDVFSALLHQFYPPPTVTFNSLDAIKPVIVAADKYQMDGVTGALKGILLDKFVADQPLRVYILATRFGWSDVKVAAIRHYLTLPADEADAHIPELDELTASAYHTILCYRRSYLMKLKEILKGLHWIQDGGWTFVCCMKCPRASVGAGFTLYGSSALRQPTVWFWRHYQYMGELLESKPSRKTLEDPLLCEAALKEASRCDFCRDSVHEHMRLLVSSLGIQMDLALDTTMSTVQ